MLYRMEKALVPPVVPNWRDTLSFIFKVDDIVVVALKVLFPVKVWLFPRYAMVEEPANWLMLRPDTVEPAPRFRAVATFNVPMLAVVILEDTIVVVVKVVVALNVFKPVKV